MARTSIQNTKRRGAVYWWRRKISLTHLGYFSKRPINCEFSLFTKELNNARGRAAAMTAYSERLKMNFRDFVRQNGLDDKTRAKIFGAELQTYRNEIICLEGVWKANSVWSRVSNHDNDFAILEALWDGIAKEGIGVPLNWGFVERNFHHFDEETQSKIQFVLRNLKTLPESLRLAAQTRLEMANTSINAINIADAANLIVPARAEAA